MNDVVDIAKISLFLETSKSLRIYFCIINAYFCRVLGESC